MTIQDLHSSKELRDIYFQEEEFVPESVYEDDDTEEWDDEDYFIDLGDREVEG